MTVKNNASLYIEQGTVYKPIQPVANAMQRIRREARKSRQDVYIVSGNDSDHQMDSFHCCGGRWNILYHWWSAGCHKPLFWCD